MRGLVAAIALAISVAASAAEAEPRAIAMVLHGPADFDGDALRAAVGAELGASVAQASDDGGGVDVLVIDVTPPRATVVFRARDGRTIERTLDLPSDPARARTTLALLAGNLARNEAEDLEASLAPPPAPSSPPPPRALPPPPATRPASPCPDPHVPIASDFVPYVGMSSAPFFRGRKAASINAVGGMSPGVSGIAVSGVFDIETDTVCGAQVAGISSVARDIRGIQVGGIVNVARDVDGAQAGVVNVASGRVHGVQVGVVNVADDSDFSLGVVSIVRKGRTHVDLWGLESGIAMAGVEHGGAHFQGLYGVGARVVDGRFAVALGFGGHWMLAEDVSLDADALGYTLYDKTVKSPTALLQIRPRLGLRLLRGLSVFAGPTANLSIASGDPAKADLSPWSATSLRSNIRAWPGITLGIEML